MRFGEGEILDDFERVTDPALPTRPRPARTLPVTKAAKPPAPEPMPAPPQAKPARMNQPTPKPEPPLERITLRPWQGIVRKSPARFLVPCTHRRAGKTINALDWLIDTCINCPLERPRAYYVATTMKAAKMIAWDILRGLVAGMNVKLSEYELTCTFRENGAKLQFLSSTQYQSHRGIYADAICMDEASLQPPSAWTMVFRPALADRLGKALFISTPQGKGFFYKLWKHGQTAENWASWLYTVADTGLIPEDELIDLRATMPDHQYRQEMLCDFDVARMGAYFGSAMNAMDDAGRLRAVAYDQELPVYASWFLPKSDGAVVTFWQQARDEMRCIDAIWKQQTTMPELVEEVVNKPFDVARNYVSKKHELDHFASRISQARGLGLRFQLTDELPLIDGIWMAKPLLERAHIDTVNCEDVSEAFRQYHAEWDEVREKFEDAPFSDWTENFAGSLITLAASHNPRRSNWNKPLHVSTPTSRRAA